jgi:hypothetical protein
MKKYKFLKCIFFFVLITISAFQSNAAEIAMENRIGGLNKERISIIYIKGNIDSDDSKKILRLIKEAKYKKSVVIGLVLNSRGGNWSEGIEIGNIARNYGLYTASPLDLSGGRDYIANSCSSFEIINGKFTPKRSSYSMFSNGKPEGDTNCECTSACALIWAGGIIRGGNRVGFHRPYINK